MELILGVVIIVLAVIAVGRGLDVRLVLILAALVLGTLGGKPDAVVRAFLVTFSDERFVVPICTAMGFAYVLRLTECDKHLVHMLLKPIQYVRWALIPGTVLVGFLVNIPVISQTSTAVALGSVVIPLLLAARIPALTVGATLLLGASVGGELLNPGAPEVGTIVAEVNKLAPKLKLDSPDCVERILPLNLLGLAVSLAVFWFLSWRADRKATPTPVADSPPSQQAPEFRVNPVKALIPLLPLVLLFLMAAPLRLVSMPTEWLVVLPPAREEEIAGLFDIRLIGLAMLIGTVAAALTGGAKFRGVGGAFFEGAGYGFTHIISLIVAAQCFGEGVKAIGLAKVLGELIAAVPWLLLPLAGLLPLGFAALSGSGMAATSSLYQFFAAPALSLGIDPTLVGAVVALGSAAGRTMSPVAAVTLMSASLTGSNALDLSRRVAVPLLAGVTAVVVAAILLASAG